MFVERATPATPAVGVAAEIADLTDVEIESGGLVNVDLVDPGSLQRRERPVPYFDLDVCSDPLFRRQHQRLGWLVSPARRT